MTEFDYYRAACHEAGHAVGSYVVGVPIAQLYVTPGLSACVPGLTFGEAAKRGLVRECAIIAQLGPETERALFGTCDAACCEGDMEMIEKGWLDRIEDPSEREALRSALPKLARDMIRSPGFLSAVEALATELVRRPGVRKEIDPAATAMVIQATIGQTKQRKNG